MNKWIAWTLKNQKLILLSIVIITILLSAGLSELTLSTDVNHIIKISQSNDDDSGLTEERDIRILIHAPNLLENNKSIQLLSKLQEQLKQVPGITSVTSLFTLPDLNKYFATNKLQPVIEPEKEQTTKSLASIRETLEHNHLYQKRVISPDLNTTVISAKVGPQKDEAAQYHVRNEIEKIIDQYKNNFQNIYQIGSLEISYEIRRDTLRDIGLLSSLAVIVLISLFSFFFRKFIYGALPFITSALALLWTLGLVSSLGIALNIFSGVAIIITFAIGVMECAHFIHAYQTANQKNENLNQEQKLNHMFKVVFIPIIFATLTTLFGFALNMSSDSAAIKDIGIIICLSIVVNTLLICSLTLIILNKFNNRQSSTCKSSTDNRSEHEFKKLYQISLAIYQKLTKHPKAVFISLFLIIILAVYCAKNTKLEILPYAGYYENSNAIKKLNMTKELLTGVDYLTANITAKNSGAFHKNNNLEKLFEAENEINQLTETSSTLSTATALASVYQIFMDYQSNDYYKIPGRQLYTDEALKELNKEPQFSWMLNKDATNASVFIIYKVLSTQAFDNYQHSVINIFKRHFPSGQFKINIDSYYNTARVTLSHVYKMQLVSLLAIYLTMLIIMWYLFKSFKAGLFSLIPNILPISFIMIAVYLLQVPIFGLTIIALAAVVGLAVDDTLHIMCAYKKAYAETLDSQSAIKHALKAQIRPVSIASISLVLGMLTLCFSTTKGIMLFGAIMASGALSAWLTDLLITPFLLNYIKIKIKT